MMKLFNQIRRFRILSILPILVLLSFPLSVLSAEVLQVKSSTLLQIGDRNRSFSVRIACANVNPDNESHAFEFLKSELPRGKRVNLRPKGSNNGVLIAYVKPIDSDIDITQELLAKGYGKFTC